jgi:hypothetical protein
MNPSLFSSFKIILITFFVQWLIGSFDAQAGLILTKTKDVQIGNATEDANGISLESQFGTLSFKKDDLAWYSTERTIDTIFKAAQLAASQGDSTSALILYEISITKETTTQSQAKSEMEDIRTKLVQSVTETLPSSPAIDVDSLTPEEKIARGTQMVENGNRFLQTTATDPKIIAANKATGEELIKDGNHLISRGQEELAERKAQQEADEARRREMTKSIEEANQSIQAMADFRKYSDDEKRNLLIAAGLFALVTLLSLWQITMKEHQQS